MPEPTGSRPGAGPARASTHIEVQVDRPKLSPSARSATLIECEEDAQPTTPAAAAAPSQRPTTAPAASTPAESRCEPYRPTSRVAMAILTAFDDGSTEGEVFRIRGDRFVIGRTEGDLVLPHDGRITSRHVEIARRPGTNRWTVTDLQSTNGLFVRVRRALLADRSEILVGAGRYRFEMPGPSAPASPQAPSRNQTLGWDGAVAPPQSPSLVELIGSQVGASVVLMRPEYWIGRDSSCPIRRADDRFCEPKHARLHRTPDGEWVAEHNRALNGLWLRMDQVEVDSVVQFQIGEQRFRLKV